MCCDSTSSSSLLSFVDSPPSQRFNHRNFISCTCMHVWLQDMHMKYQANIIYILKMVSIFLFSNNCILPFWLIIKPCYFIQMCIASKHLSGCHTCDFLIQNCSELHMNLNLCYIAVADPGFPVGGAWTSQEGGCGLPRRLCFEDFVCQNERIGTLRGGAHAGRAPQIRQCIDLIYFLDTHFTFSCQMENQLMSTWTYFYSQHLPYQLKTEG